MRRTGQKKECGDAVWKVEMEILTIGKIDIESTNSPGVEQDGVKFDNYKAQKGYVERYMCCETGIGCGSCFPVDILFPSVEEAQKECDNRNSGG